MFKNMFVGKWRVLIALVLLALANAEKDLKCFNETWRDVGTNKKYDTQGPFVMFPGETDYRFHVNDDVCKKIGAFGIINVRVCHTDRRDPQVVFYNDFNGNVHRVGEPEGVVIVTIELYCSVIV